MFSDATFSFFPGGWAPAFGGMVVFDIAQILITRHIKVQGAVLMEYCPNHLFHRHRRCCTTPWLSVSFEIRNA